MPGMVEIELHVLKSQCLIFRFDKIEEIQSEAQAWQQELNNKEGKINWQFTNDKVRVKHKKLYQTI